MSVSNSVNKTIYNGDGSTKAFPFSYSGSNILVYSSSDIGVYIVNTSTGVQTTKTITTDYSVALTSYGNAGQYTATITMVTAPALTEQLVLIRTLPQTQLISVVDNEKVPASTLNQLYDRTVCLIQQVQEQIGRAILGAVNQTAITIPAPSVGKVLGWDVSGNLTNVTANTGAYLSKASQATAEAASDDSSYMTPLQVKNEVQKLGAVAIPVANISGLSVSDAQVTFTDITTNDVSISKHGYAPKLPNDATKFLNGTGRYTVPQVGLGSPSSKTVGTTYQAATDGFVVVVGSTANNGLDGYSDASATPTTLRGSLSGISVNLSFTFPVLKTHYYKVTGSATAIAYYFYSIGS